MWKSFKNTKMANLPWFTLSPGVNLIEVGCQGLPKYVHGNGEKSKRLLGLTVSVLQQQDNIP